uniref:Uncharacterized protein n=1 Tax=Ananas comosus var. bracteatus TaxID=296719 RepID=A0A6V7PY12_ANACO|nr:unnamed protein product [Ananas comosus var. bracteatus]
MRNHEVSAPSDFTDLYEEVELAGSFCYGLTLRPDQSHLRHLWRNGGKKPTGSPSRYRKPTKVSSSGTFVGANEGRPRVSMGLASLEWEKTSPMGLNFVGRSPQTGTPEIAIATYARSYGIGRRNGMPWGRLIPRVGMLTITGPLGTAQAGLPMGRSCEIWNKRLICFRRMAGLDTYRAGFRWVPGCRDSQAVSFGVSHEKAGEGHGGASPADSYGGGSSVKDLLTWQAKVVARE